MVEVPIEELEEGLLVFFFVVFDDAEETRLATAAPIWPARPFLSEDIVV